MFTTPTLTVNLAAIVTNWQTLRAQFTGRETAAVVKADAYGLGAVEVSTALEKAGCHTFFVATIEEAIALRAALSDVRILVLSGIQEGEEFAFAAHRLIPVLNSAAQIERWKPVAAEHIHAVSALHIDTAMGRLGLQADEFLALLKKDPNVLSACRVSLIMSHLACAPDAQHPLNAQQLTLLQSSLALAPGIPVSLTNSGGVFLPNSFHFDLARPGCSLYGIAAQAFDGAHAARSAMRKPRSVGDLGEDSVLSPSRRVPPSKSPPSEESSVAFHGEPRSVGGLGATPPSILNHVATWNAPILMTRLLERDQTLGYGATVTAAKGTRIATVASGYADGYLRQLSNKAVGYVGEHQVKLLGRVTMDMLCFDVTHVPENLLHDGAPLTLLGDRDGIRVDEIADAAGTIGYEILTRIGPRVKRIYVA